MDLLPDRIGLIGGLLYWLNFGLGGVPAAFLGGLADSYGVEAVYRMCAFLPLAGVLALFLPRIDETSGLGYVSEGHRRSADGRPQSFAQCPPAPSQC